jgi:hypothetical protein
MTRFASLLLLAAALLGTGCAQMKMGAPVPGIENIQKARASGIPAVALGTFKLAPGKDAALDQRVVVRTNSIYSPYDSSFASYLKESLAVDLAAAGLLNAASTTVISGLLTDSQLNVPTGPANATVAARFTVTRAGANVYEKELRASSAWTASFIGVEAISGGLNEYGLLYRKLLAQLLDDPQFVAALRK